MDQIKIGKLIAKLRKEKGLTQQQLGEKVHVGDRAVSKWERGITLPDIAIINELSEILGITSDELLKGELNKVEEVTEKKFNYKLLLLLIPVLIIVAIIIIANRENGDVYTLRRNSTGYSLQGKLTINDKEMSIFINNIKFEDYDFTQQIVINYEYKLISQNQIICGLGDIDYAKMLDVPVSVEDLFKTFSIDYKMEIPTDIDRLLNNNFILKFIFVDEDNNKIEKNMEIEIIHKNTLF